MVAKLLIKSELRLSVSYDLSTPGSDVVIFKKGRFMKIRQSLAALPARSETAFCLRGQRPPFTTLHLRPAAPTSLN